MALPPGVTAIITTQTTALSLRSAPVTSSPAYGAGSNVIGQLPKGSTVRIDGPPQGGFYPVSTPAGQSGFAGAAYLTEAPAAVAAAAADIPISFEIPDAGAPAAAVDASGAPVAAPAGPNKKLLLGGAAVLLLGIVALAAGGKKKRK